MLSRLGRIELDDEYPSPRCVGGYSATDDRPKEQRQSVHYRDICNKLGILLGRNEFDDDDRSEGPASATTDALESPEDDPDIKSCQPPI